MYYLQDLRAFLKSVPGVTTHNWEGLVKPEPRVDNNCCRANLDIERVWSLSLRSWD